MKSIKPLFLACLLMGASGLSQAQNIETLFAKMPSSILPGISAETRMDLIDFYKNGKAAVMPAVFGGKVELKVLANDYLLLKTSMNAAIQLKLLRQMDGSSVIVFVRTAAAPLKDSRIRCYDLAWKQVPVIAMPRLTPLDFLSDASKADASMLESLALQGSRFFQTYSFEPNSTSLIVRTSLKEELSLTVKDKLSPLLKDSVLFQFVNGRFVSN